MDRLEKALGPEWLARATGVKDPPPLAMALPWIGGHALALADALEWALGLHLLRNQHGMARVRREASANATAGRGLHTALQLQLAGHAQRLGWEVALEPSGLPPADVAITTPNGRIVVEARVVTESLASKTERAAIDELTGRLQNYASAHDMWLSGRIERALRATEVAAVADWITSVSAAATTPADLRRDGFTLHVVQRDRASDALRGPRLDDDLVPPLATFAWLVAGSRVM